ncbi:MAG: glycosyltransferase [Gammaproteobacteria bacterium]|nr:glycosyltransferase [Gammaproteobacteria bacterium]
MRILYGVQGTGNGHITRARALSTELAKANIEVDYIFSGRPGDEYFNMEPFGSYKTYRGLTFATRDGQLQFFKTALTNSVLNLRKEIKSLDVQDYDLVITDFEPVTAWAARLQHKFSIGIGHQYAFQYAIPIEGSNWAAKSVMKHFAPANVGLGVHWHHFNNPILPPIIEPPFDNTPVQSRKILVYLPFENLQQICNWLAPEKDYEFYVYHHLSAPQDMGHLHLRPFSRDKFQMDLASCEGVITNSGFELASEAIQYGKKILTKPLHGQMEQISNAAALKILKRADVITTLNPAALKAWLQKKNPAPVRYPNVAAEIVQWIINGRREPLESLSQRLWNSCEPAIAFEQRDRVLVTA